MATNITGSPFSAGATERGTIQKSSSTTFVYKLEDSQPVPPANIAKVLGRATTQTPPDTGAEVYWKPSTRGAWRLSKTLGSEPEFVGALRQKTASQTSLTNLRSPLDPSLSDFASIFSSFDRLGSSPFSKKIDSDASADEQDNSLVFGKHVSQCEEQSMIGGKPSSRPHEGAEPGSKSYQRHHRRNAAAMRISTTRVSTENSMQNYSEVQADDPIFAQETISPTRQLREKDSAPQLMKALPPLPAGVKRPSSQATDNSFTDNSFSLKQVGQNGVKPDEMPDKAVNYLTTKTLVSSVEEVRSSEDQVPKFKIRVKASPSSNGVTDASEKGQRGSQEGNYAAWEQGSSVTGKPRLKLKVSRSQLGQGRSGENGVTPYNNRLKQCNSLANLAQCPRSNKSVNYLNFDGTINEDLNKSCSVCSTGTAEDAGLENLPSSPQLSDQFNISYPPSPEMIQGGLQSGTSTSEPTLSEMHSCSSDISPNDYRGLRGKLSMFRLRLIGTQLSVLPKTCEPTQLILTSETTVPCDAVTVEINSKVMVSSDANADAKSHTVSTKSDKMQERVKRWATDAKRVVRLYFRRTLDRSSRLNN